MLYSLSWKALPMNGRWVTGHLVIVIMWGGHIYDWLTYKGFCKQELRLQLMYVGLQIYYIQ